VAASAHNGVVWLHLSAIVIWLVIAAVFGAVAASGRDLPAVVFVATLGAAAGHAIFLAVHSFFAAVARRRQAALNA
jgi:ABC-type polysaccharide/polyol phosphate export permease